MVKSAPRESEWLISGSRADLKLLRFRSDTNAWQNLANLVSDPSGNLLEFGSDLFSGRRVQTRNQFFELGLDGSLEILAARCRW